MEWTILIGGVLAATYVFVRRDRHYPLEDRLPIIRHAIENGNDVQMTYFTYSNRKFTRRADRAPQRPVLDLPCSLRPRTHLHREPL
jgi:hypothetical protein